MRKQILNKKKKKKLNPIIQKNKMLLISVKADKKLNKKLNRRRNKSKQRKWMKYRIDSRFL